MRITRGNLAIFVLCLYLLSVYLMYTNLRNLTLIEQEEIVVHVHTSDDEKVVHKEDEKVDVARGTEKEATKAVLNSTLTPFKPASNSSSITAVEVSDDPNFPDGAPFYCNGETRDNGVGESLQSRRDIEFFRLGVAEIFFLSEAYLDLRPGYRSPSIRVLTVISHSVNASQIVASVHLCATDAKNRSKTSNSRRIKEMRLARILSQTNLPNFAYEFNENHNKPLRGYIITFALEPSHIRLGAFPAYIKLGHTSASDTHTLVRIRKMMPSAFLLEKTNEFKPSDAQASQISLDKSQHQEAIEQPENVPIQSDEVLRRLYTDWHAQHARDYRYKFAVCVPPLFGSVDVHRLIEFIEMHRVLGASRFVFYVYRLHNRDEVDELLAWYTERLSNGTKHKDAVMILRWNMPFDEGQIWYHGQLLAIHHCLYENVGISRYTAFNDIDEAIVPRTASNWHEMLAGLDTIYSGRVARPAGFRFRSAFFDTTKSGLSHEQFYIAKLFGGDMPGTKPVEPTNKDGPVWPPVPIRPRGLDQIQIDGTAKRFLDGLKPAEHTDPRAISLLTRFGELRFGRFVERNDPPTRVRTKCIVKPDFVFEMGIHHVSKQHVEEMEPRDVEDSIVLLHHYRTCEAAYDVSCNSFVSDFTLIERHKRQLYLNLAQTLASLADNKKLPKLGLVPPQI